LTYLDLGPQELGMLSTVLTAAWAPNPSFVLLWNQLYVRLRVEDTRSFNNNETMDADERMHLRILRSAGIYM
jgi:hypothetical protein